MGQSYLIGLSFLHTVYQGVELRGLLQIFLEFVREAGLLLNLLYYQNNYKLQT